MTIPYNQLDRFGQAARLSQWASCNCKCAPCCCNKPEPKRPEYDREVIRVQTGAHSSVRVIASGAFGPAEIRVLIGILEAQARALEPQNSSGD